MPQPRRITVVTSGHLSTCPRMLKSADALAAAGYAVRVVATSAEPWAVEADRDVRSRRDWPATIINYRKGDSGVTYWSTGAPARAARFAVSLFGAGRLPIVARAFGRTHAELVRAAMAEPADPDLRRHHRRAGGDCGSGAALADAVRCRLRGSAQR